MSIQWEETAPDDCRFQLKSHVPMNTKLHIAWKIIHKIRTSKYSWQVGHAQVPMTHKDLARSESAGRRNSEREEIPLAACLASIDHSNLWSLMYLAYTPYRWTNSSYSTTLFPHLSAICILPSYPASTPQISLQHLFFLLTKARLGCRSAKKTAASFFPVVPGSHWVQS